MWMTTKTKEFLRSGHYSARAVLAGEPFGPHDPAECDYDCPRWQDESHSRRAEL
jgi:hypothetical protein